MPSNDRDRGVWTTDRLLGGRLVVRQPARGYRIAIDTVLLAAAVPARPGRRLVELGAGVGGAALAVAAR
ncbi:MAG: methyltransferase, partial [Alphaproteobacteria bacterium]